MFKLHYNDNIVNRIVLFSLRTDREIHTKTGVFLCKSENWLCCKKCYDLSRVLTRLITAIMKSPSDRKVRFPSVSWFKPHRNDLWLSFEAPHRVHPGCWPDAQLHLHPPALLCCRCSRRWGFSWHRWRTAAQLGYHWRRAEPELECPEAHRPNRELGTQWTHSVCVSI